VEGFILFKGVLFLKETVFFRIYLKCFVFVFFGIVKDIGPNRGKATPGFYPRKKNNYRQEPPRGEMGNYGVRLCFLLHQ